MTTEGDQIALGDVADSLDENGEITYEVLCRRHHLRKVISRNSNAALPQSLPFTTSS
jgi:thymidine kinase